MVTAPDKVAAENHMVLLFSRCVSCEGSRLFISHNFAVSGFQSYLCLNTLYGLTYGYEFSIPLCHFPEFIILEYINNLKPLVCVSDWFLLLQGCMLHSMTVLLLVFKEQWLKLLCLWWWKTFWNKMNRKRQKEQNEKRWIYFKNLQHLK